MDAIAIIYTRDARTWATVVVVEGLRSGHILDLKVKPTEYLVGLDVGRKKQKSEEFWFEQLGE